MAGEKEPELTDGCWNCECEQDYIHAKIRESECPTCGTKEEDQPDSHAEEAAAFEPVRMTPEEYAEFPGMCPFCHNSDVDEDNDGKCTCRACDSSWKIERITAGYSWVKEGQYNEETKDFLADRTALEKQARVLREALVKAKKSLHYASRYFDKLDDASVVREVEEAEEIVALALEGIKHRRANQAWISLKAGKYTDGNPPGTAITDLLADLRHLCDAKGLDFADLDRIAYNHYSHEPKAGKACPEKKSTRS